MSDRRRSRVFLHCAAAVLASSVVCATDDLQLEQVTLTSADRATLESKACKPFHVRAESVSGWRLTIYPKSPPNAQVECAPHLITQTYSVYHMVHCSKAHLRWRCADSGLFVQAQVFGQGPYDIDVQGLEPEEAVSALRCLETGLRQRPDLTGAELKAEPERVIGRNYGKERAPTIEVSVSTSAKRCLSLSFARTCDPNSQVSLVVESEACVGE